MTRRSTRPVRPGLARASRRLVAVVATLALALGLAGVTAGPAAAVAACVDLRVSSIAVTPTTVVAGQVIEIRFQVQNTGTCATPPEIRVDIVTDLGVGGCCVSSIPDLGPGQTSELYLSTTQIFDPGAHEAGIVVDLDNAIPETDETNNRSSVPVTVKAPTVDLVLTEVRFEPVRPVRGRPMKAIFTVLNLGTTTSKPFTMTWQPAWNLANRDTTGGAVAAGGSTEVTFDYTYASYWNFDSGAEIRQDPSQNPEISYRNNSLRFQVPVDPVGTDLVVQGVQVSPSNPAPGQAATATFTIRNTGTTDASRFHFSWQPYEGTTLRTAYLSGLAAGATTTVAFKITVPTTDVLQGLATVDPRFAVKETEEGNNAMPVNIPVAPKRINLSLLMDFDTGGAKVGDRVTVKALVKNSGNTASGPFRVDWNPDTTGLLAPGDRTQSQDIDSLGRGEQKTLTFSYVYPKVGEYTTSVSLDQDHRVVELTTKDNRRAYPFPVAPAAGAATSRSS